MHDRNGRPLPNYSVNDVQYGIESEEEEFEQYAEEATMDRE
jgi:hypothetical protein